MRPAYPWSAVIGQDALKHALLLCAVDPGIGGVLLHGPRGVAKTTLARALAQLVEGAFVELPLGASDERVTGTLDLGAVLRDGQVAFQPGLLARADGGVLYVDEVNLLPDALVDLLLDAAASGQNVVERDGVSHAHAARFVLVGTMNPDEGELRPQLTDRFGLSVAATAEILPPERARIVAARLAYEQDATGFVAAHADAQDALRARCRHARATVATIPLDGPALARVTELCHAAGVEGVRADLAMLRAARAHAAWHDRDAITDADVDAVAELALAHRRRTPPEPPRSGGRGGAGPSPNAGGGGAPTTSSSPGARSDEAPRSHQSALAPVPVAPAPAPSLPAWLIDARAAQAEARRRGLAKSAAQTAGRRDRAHAEVGSIAWFPTLVAARGRRPTLADLRRRARRTPAKHLWVVALDCSASMLRAGALARAKGVTAALERAAARTGAHLAVLAFRGDETQLARAPEARIGRGEVAALGAGGGTPLRAALRAARALCDARKFRGGEVAKHLFVLTDGRTREPVADLLARRTDLARTVIDCERGAVRLSRAETLAAALGADLLHVDTLG
ncbi:MAG: AAA family ATPase [Polyangiales bacterium]